MTSEIVGRGQCVAGAMPQWLLLHRRVVQHNLLWPVDLVVSSRVGAATRLHPNSMRGLASPVMFVRVACGGSWCTNIILSSSSSSSSGSSSYGDSVRGLDGLRCAYPFDASGGREKTRAAYKR